MPGQVKGDKNGGGMLGRMGAREQEKSTGTVVNRGEAGARKSGRGKVMKQNEKIDERIGREGISSALLFRRNPFPNYSSGD